MKKKHLFYPGTKKTFIKQKTFIGTKKHLFYPGTKTYYFSGKIATSIKLIYFFSDLSLKSL
jgi:hypothetical protein